MKNFFAKKHYSFEDLNNGEVHGIKAISENKAWLRLAEILKITNDQARETFSLVAIEEK